MAYTLWLLAALGALSLCTASDNVDGIADILLRYANDDAAKSQVAEAAEKLKQDNSTSIEEEEEDPANECGTTIDSVKNPWGHIPALDNLWCRILPRLPKCLKIKEKQEECLEALRNRTLSVRGIGAPGAGGENGTALLTTSTTGAPTTTKFKSIFDHYNEWWAAWKATQPPKTTTERRRRTTTAAVAETTTTEAPAPTTTTEAAPSTTAEAVTTTTAPVQPIFETTAAPALEPATGNSTMLDESAESEEAEESEAKSDESRKGSKEEKDVKS